MNDLMYELNQLERQIVKRSEIVDFETFTHKVRKHEFIYDLEGKNTSDWMCDGVTCYERSFKERKICTKVNSGPPEKTMERKRPEISAEKTSKKSFIAKVISFMKSDSTMEPAIGVAFMFAASVFISTILKIGLICSKQPSIVHQKNKNPGYLTSSSSLKI